MSKASSEYTGFGMAVGHKYILDYFDEAAKDRVRWWLITNEKNNSWILTCSIQASQLVTNMIFAFKELVDESEWMDAETQVCSGCWNDLQK